MEYFYIIFLLISCVSYVQTQKFTQESPYMLIRFMDLKMFEWKPGMLDQLEKVLDAELKYKDAKKGTECRSIDFEQEAGYPKQNARFLDLSIRGLCTDETGKVHDIEKEIIIVAIERNMDAVNAVTGASVYKVGHVQVFKRDRNMLNLIIIPVSVLLIIILIIVTFVLRSVRYKQKRRHIESELQKKRDNSGKKAQTIANVDPHANEKQHLLQLDPTVVGSASDTLGSPKEFTSEQYPSPSRNNNNREYQGGQPPPVPSKQNRPPYYNRDDDTSFQNQRSSRERIHVPYENQPRFSPNQYEQEHPEIIAMQEQQPRVVVRTMRDDRNQPSYSQQHDEPSSVSFVPIPVQIERSGAHQRFVPPPYHSDPYYRHNNA